MKKLFFAEILIFLILISSCSTTDNQTIIHDCLLEAEDYYSQNMLEEAVNSCQIGFKKTNDYRLLYNQAIYTALSGNYHIAADLALKGYSTFPDKNEFLIAALKYMELDNDYNLLYRTAIEQWNNGNTSSEIIRALYIVKPEEWTNLYKAIN